MASDPWAAAAAIMAAGVGSKEAVYRQRNAAQGMPVRLTISVPDRVVGMIQGAAAALHVQRSAIPVVQAGDEFLVDGEVYQVIEPNLDEERVTWVLPCSRVNPLNRGSQLLARASR